MNHEVPPPPPMTDDFGPAWAEVERTRLGYRITAGPDGLGVYEMSWFRFRHEAARRKARRIIDQANWEQQRHIQRERLT